MEQSLADVQQSMYGENGPPMFPPSASKARSPCRVKRRKLKPSHEPFRLPPIKPVNELKGPESLVACQLPDGFPPELAFRALAAYALLRTLSRELRLSPFTPNVFLRALNLPYPSRLLGQVHVNLLRILLPRLNLGYGYRPHGGSIGIFKKRRLDGIRWPLLGGDNLSYLDNYTWPLFYDDYCHLTADVLWVSMNDTNLYIDLRQIGDPTENSDDEAEKVEDNMEIGSPDPPEASQASKKGSEKRESLPVAEPIQDSDDEYNGEDDEDMGGENDDEFEMSKLKSKKRRRSSAKQALPRKLFRSTRSSPQVPPTQSVTESSSSVRNPSTSGVYNEQDLLPISVLRAKSNTKAARASTSPQYASPSMSTTPNSITRSKVVREDTSTVASTGNAMVSEGGTAVSGTPLSRAALFGAATKEAELQLVTPSVVGGVEGYPVNGANQAYEAHHQQRMFQSHDDRQLASQVVASQTLPSASSITGVVAGSSRLNLSPPSGQQSRQQGISAPSPGVAAAKRPVSRFALPLNRARNHAAPSSQASNVTPQGQAHVQAGVPHSNFTVRWDHSVALKAPFQHHAPYPSQVMMLEEIRPFPRVAGLPLHNRAQDNFLRVNLPPAVTTVTTERKTGQMEVRAAIADELENAFMGSEPVSTNDAVETASRQSDSIADEVVDIETPVSEAKDGNDLTSWPQFKAIKRMRTGHPYHCLPLEEKLDVLEFLIDELLAIDFIAAEFTKRDAVNGGHPIPYGCLPSQTELDSLENEDECGICGREGDLLCCDECTSSYHTFCIGMAQSTRIPEGKWVCPECRLADPCKFGSLRGGKKGSVDWFTSEDLLAAEKFKDQPYTQYYEAALDTNNPYLERSTFQEKINGVTGSELVSVPRRDALGWSMGVGEIEFLVVGSFVFTRPRGTDVVQTLGRERPRSENFLPLNQDTLAQWFLKLGPELGSMWPFAQVPQNPREVWNGKALAANYVPSTLYFATLDSHDPSFYWSQYRKAPLPKSMKAGAGAQSASLSELENEFVAVDTNRLSGVLSRDMQFDGVISRELRSSTCLFDPYHVIASFMVRLEGSLRKAGLLDETWGTLNSDFKTDAWVQNVKRCQSIPRLAFLLVKLVDATHPRAFVDEWHKIPGNSKSAETSSGNTASSLSARRFNLPKDWSSEAELLRRKWERCPLWAMRALMAKPSQNGSRCITAPTQPSGRKRKHGVVPVKMDQSNSETANPAEAADGGDQQSPINGEFSNRDEGQSKLAFEPASNSPLLSEMHPDFPSAEMDNNLEAGGPEDGASGRSSRRRPARVTTRSGAWVSTESTGAMEAEDTPLSEMGLLVESEQSKKLIELEKFGRAPSSREVHWPLAGRKLFEPAGYLPPLEMRRLARKAGAAAAPFVTYSATHEVGQTAVCHRWRKRTLECKSYEEILLRIKSLESFIETSTVSAGDTLMRRSTSSKKQLSMNIIGCSHRDLLTGVVEYFVLDSNRRRGCWVSLASMDIAPIILDLSDRAETQLKKMEGRMKIVMEQRNKAILASSIQSANVVLPMQAFADSDPQQVRRHKEGRSRDEIGRPQKSQKRETTDLVGSASSLESHIQKWNQEVEASLLQHQIDTRQLMIDRTKQGLTLLPPESQMQELRLQRMRCLQTPLDALRRCGDSNALETEIVARLTQAEINALKMLEGAQLAKERVVEPVSSWPATLNTPSQVQSLSSNYGLGADAMNRASSGSHSFETTGRSMMEPVPSTAPPPMNSFTYPPAAEFDPTGGRTNSASLGFSSTMLPYFQPTPSLPPSSLPYAQNGATAYHNMPMNVNRDPWSQNSAMAPSQPGAHSSYVPGTNPQFMNTNVAQGMLDGYSQLRNNGFVNHNPYSQPAPYQTNPTDPYFSQQHNLNSFLPSYQLTPMGSMQPVANGQHFGVNFNSGARPVQQQLQQQTFAPHSSAPPGELPIGFDFEPRPIEEMSQNNNQDLESLLRRFTRYPR